MSVLGLGLRLLPGTLLWQAGYRTVSEVASAPDHELLEIAGFGAAFLMELREAIKHYRIAEEVARIDSRRALEAAGKLQDMGMAMIPTDHLFAELCRRFKKIEGLASQLGGDS